MRDRRSADRGYSDVYDVGPHLVIAKHEWVPGPHPDPHLREQEQTEYVESYYRCIRCEAERLRKRDFPDECDPEPLDGERADESTDGEPAGTSASADRERADPSEATDQ